MQYQEIMKVRQIKEAFKEFYGGDPIVYRAPGRINLIGEHTDYNDGFVMPAAIDSYTWAAIAPRDDRKLIIRSTNFEETVEFDLDDPDPSRRLHWSDYPHGVAVILERSGRRLRGANMLIHGEVPIGSGLSSSAAIEVATAYALVGNSGGLIDRLGLARLCQRAENDFVGMECGLMDQFISCFGQAGKVLMLDCRSLDYEPLPLPPNASLVVCNTMVKHELATSKYNERRRQCEEGVRLLGSRLKSVRSLRDVTPEEFEKCSSDFPEATRRRCRHVISENARVLRAKRALEKGDLQGFGCLMRESHRSLAEDYEVSCPELDLMVRLASESDGVYGARMTGGGFGGCTINLVEAQSEASFRQSISAAYEKETGRKPEIYVCSPAQGAARVLSD